ncbi:cytochrome b5-like [Aristolochia californica]|uniref:cytochrome b5-like n=1 Tax=Aristolochia californica TaxID=171875 RepID=UPI0035DA9A67
MPTITKLFTLQEASEHNKKEDCWVVIDGKIYDVTSYLDEHPGGDDVLLAATGKDATDDFEDAGHSQSARDLMKDYCIGELDPSPPPPPPPPPRQIIHELEIVSKQQSINLKDLLRNKTLRYCAIPTAIIGIAVVVGLLYNRKK